MSTSLDVVHLQSEEIEKQSIRECGCWKGTRIIIGYGKPMYKVQLTHLCRSLLTKYSYGVICILVVSNVCLTNTLQAYTHFSRIWS